MPKLTWMNRKPVKVNYLAALFREYRLLRGMPAAKVAEAVGCSEDNARCQMNKRPGAWNIEQLMRYCDALEIPYEDAFDMAVKSCLPAGKAGRQQGKL